LTDSYKVSHYKQYPPNTTNVYSYFESRGGEFPETLFFGLQYITKKYLVGKVITQEKIDEAELIFSTHFGNKSLFNKKGWEHILNKHDGCLPVIIKAVQEGSIIPTNNVLMTIENTDPEVPWLTNYLETLLVQTWYPTTVATLSKRIKWLIESFLGDSGTPELIDYKLHDFGFRGVSSVESAGIGGCAHLVNFKGTDTLESLQIARKYYNCSEAGFSIPAAEHSTITSWGKLHEKSAYVNMLNQFPEGTVAVVSDSYNIEKACHIWGKLKDKVLLRNGKLVIRPDSGDPPKVVLSCLEILGSYFGYITNSKNFKVLNDKVRLIQGDGINISMIWKILVEIQGAGWSADNISFGTGGTLLQKLNRDTQNFAFKCSSVTVNGLQRDVFKKPITDPNKNSKRGRLKLVNINGKYKTVSKKQLGEDLLVPIFRNGELLKDYTLEEIRSRANSY
jgi:nicotinamide phosphoribosyltransferase